MPARRPATDIMSMSVNGSFDSQQGTGPSILNASSAFLDLRPAPAEDWGRRAVDVWSQLEEMRLDICGEGKEGGSDSLGWGRV